MSQTSTTALEPLYGPPAETKFSSYAELCAPFTPSHALHSLLSTGQERYSNALNTVNRCLHRLDLGERFFSVEQLEQEAALLVDELKEVEFYEWCNLAFFGLPRRQYDVKDYELDYLLREHQWEDDRYEGLTLADLLDALVEVPNTSTLKP